MANGTTSTSNALVKASDVQTTLPTLLAALEALPVVRADLKAQLEDQRFTLLTTAAKDLLDAKADRAADDRALEKYRTSKTTTIEKLKNQLVALDDIEDSLQSQVATIIRSDGAEAVAIIRQHIKQIETNAEKEEKEAKKLKDLVADAEGRERIRVGKSLLDVVDRPETSAFLDILRDRLGTSDQIETARVQLETSIGVVRDETNANLHFAKTELEIAIGSVRLELLSRFGQLSADINQVLAGQTMPANGETHESESESPSRVGIDQEIPLQTGADNVPASFGGSPPRRRRNGRSSAKQGRKRHRVGSGAR